MRMHPSLSVLVIVLYTVAACSLIFHVDGRSGTQADDAAEAAHRHNLQVHLAFGERAAHEVTATWFMADEDGAELVYWEVANRLMWRQLPSGRSKSVLRAQVVRQLRKTGWPYIHSARMTGLKPATQYACFVRYKRNAGPLSTFTTMADAAAPSISNYLVFADMANVGSEPTFAALSAEVASRNYTALLHLGDIAYDLHQDNGRNGDKFMSKIGALATQLPYMTAPGNHERRSMFAQYKARFSMPVQHAEDVWYSWDAGQVHFVSLALDVYIMAGSNKEHAALAKAQLSWLAADLAKANRFRDKQPWIIVYGHRPLYCTNSGRGRDCNRPESKVRRALEFLFLRYGVDLYLCGHMHAYERSWPMIGASPNLRTELLRDEVLPSLRGVVADSRKASPLDDRELPGDHLLAPRATVHITNGLAGVKKGGQYKMDGFGEEETWSVLRFTDHQLLGYGRLSIMNGTHLQWEQIRAQDGARLDSLTIVQPSHGSFLESGQAVMGSTGTAEQDL
eukprot:jgi/Tetstr1/431314/TSEL_021006.t1